jgi:dTDP-4-dehydrorhamnose 3,5-epimerase
MIKEAFISGQTGKAIYLEGEHYFVANVQDLARPIECDPIDFSTFFNFGTEIMVLSNAPLNITYVHDQLSAQTERYRALTLTVSGMDHMLDLDSRKHAITTAARLTKTESTFHFVKARLLARPAPDEAELETAIDIAVSANASNMAALYQGVLEQDRIIALVYESWLKTAQQHLSTQVELLEYQRLLTDSGVFADFVSALASSSIKPLKSIVVRYGRREDFSELSRALLNALQTRVVEAWASSPIQRERRGSRAPVQQTSILETFQLGEISGVVVRDLRIFVDSRGWLSELFRHEDLEPELYPAMGYVSTTMPGVTRGPHEHMSQVDLFCFIGPSNFKFRMWDLRLESPTFGNVMTLVVGADNPKAVLVPKHVVHAYQNIGAISGIVINYPNKLYMGEGRRDPVDEIRHEDDPDTIFLMDD